MKLTVCRKHWFVAALTLAVVMAHSPMVWAQDNDSAQTNNQVAATNSATIEVVAVEAGTNVSGTTSEEPSHQRGRGPVVVLGGTATVNKGETAETVVAIGGSAKAGGRVQDAVVAIGGNAEADDDVGDAVVAIGGDAKARGKVGDAVVAIAGDAEVQGEVGDAVVAVMGNVKIGSNSIVRGDVVSVGGKVEVAEGGQVKGQVTEVGVGAHPALVPLMGLADWFRHCVLKLRLLAPQPGWYWVVAGIFLLCYLLITVAFPRPVAACVNELTQRPATTFLLGLLTKLLVPLVVLVLTMTGLGLIVVPFLLAAVFIAGMIGKAALFQYFGRQIVRIFGVELPNPVLAMLAGLVLITLLYLVPLLSLLVYMLTGLWGIGAAVTASFGRARKESPERPSSPPPSAMPAAAMPGGAAGPAAFAAAVPPSIGAEFAAPPISSGVEAGLPPRPMPIPSAVPPVASDALTLPRAGFLERMGAALLDIILATVLAGIIVHIPSGRAFGPPVFFLLVLAYFVGLWTWKGMTVGGVVLNLKVVRLDDQPVTFVVALVRGLAAAFSGFVLFLGFFWMIWDREKQTWHDKIAGTVVVRQPRGMPLV